MDRHDQKGMARHGLIPGLIGLNALGLLAFRHFVSLDGPMHLLHAAVLRDALFGKIRMAQGMWVDVGALDLNLGDLLLIGLSGVVHPFILHKLLAVLAVSLVCLGAWRLARSYGNRLNPVWLLVLPCAFGFTLLLGLFHFIIATGIAFAVGGWWVSRSTVRWRELFWLLLGCVLGTFAHKAGGMLLLLLVGFHEAVLRLCDAPAWRSRWAALPIRTATYLAFSTVLVGLALLALRFAASPVHPHEQHRPFWELITLRPLLLVDSQAEQPFRIALGTAFLSPIGYALWQRGRSARNLAPPDALLLAAVLLLLASLIRTPKTELLYIADRAQWLALLLTACWLSIQPFPRAFIRVVGLCIVALHGVRMVYIERRMHGMEERDLAVLAAARSFEPGALVVPVVLDNDWLARHLTAYAAIDHDGLLFTGRDHLRLDWKSPPTPYLRNYIVSPENSWNWIGAHIVKGIAPELRQVLVLGPIAGNTSPEWLALDTVLHARYRPAHSNDYAHLWSLDGP